MPATLKLQPKNPSSVIKPKSYPEFNVHEQHFRWSKELCQRFSQVRKYTNDIQILWENIGLQ